MQEALSQFPRSPIIYRFFTDFDDENQIDKFTTTALSSGTGAVTVDERCGVYRLSGAATTDNSGFQLQKDQEAFSLKAGDVARLLFRVKCSDGTEDEVFVGAAITDTTLLDGTGTLAGGLTHTDSVGIYKPDGGTNWYLVMRRDSVQISSGPISVAPTSYVDLAIQIEMDKVTAGKAIITGWVDGQSLGFLTTTTFPYDSEEILAESVAFVTGNATGTKTCDVDFVASEIRMVGSTRA